MLTAADIRPVVEAALREDAPWGDVTSDTLLPAGATATGHIVARAGGVVAGLTVADTAFVTADPAITFTAHASDGDHVAAATVLAEVGGPARAVLRAERVALNLLQRLSGTATLTAAFVAAVAGTHARITDTRKTTPGLRRLERHAVRCGGGSNHRFSLSDAVLVKDNHLAALRSAGIGLADALRQARASLPHTVTIEVEVDSLDQIDAVLDSGANAVLLDNFTVEDMKEAVARIAGRATVEASGGVSIETVRAIAETGVDVISVGALTHSAPALDIAFDLRAEIP